MKKLSEFSFSIGKKLLSIGFIFLFLAVEVWTQMPQVVMPEQQPVPEPPAEDYTWWYVMLVLLGIALGGAIYWMKVSKNKQKNEAKEKGKLKDSEAVDFDKELEWFRKNRKVINKKKPSSGKMPATFPKTGKIINSKRMTSDEQEIGGGNGQIDSKNKNSWEKYVPTTDKMPVFLIERLERTRPFDQLPISNDEALMSAVEQTQDEFEEDEGFRELSVKVLAAFKTRNAVEALSQVALYDLSSFLRSKAVTVLADFNHESVFETILLACADPTREVRAAAARGLFQLDLDRADAWSRIAETIDEYRIRQAARAAIEGELDARYFERLIHKDEKNAYEAFAFVALLLKSGETETVFEALHKHRDKNVRKAILHVIKVTKEQNALEGLYSMLEDDKLSPEMREDVDRLVEEIGLGVV